MERKAQSLSLYIGPVKLYLDDIKKIVDVLKQLPDTGRLGINIGDYKISDINEISEIKPKETSSVEIDYYNSKPNLYVSLTVTSRSVHFYCNEDTVILQGVFSLIKNHLLSRRRRWRWVESLTWITMGTATSGSIILTQGMISKY